MVTPSFREAFHHEDGPIPEQMVVTGDSFPGVRFLSAESARVIGLAALPRLRHPPSGFFTLSAVFSHPNLVALFHATSTPRILVFRAFPSSPAAISFDIRCSLVVRQPRVVTGEPVASLGPCLPSSAPPIVRWGSRNDLQQAWASTSEPSSGEESVPDTEFNPCTRSMLS
jgi:hypothetical protein